MLDSTYDIVIVGAGPSGAIATLYAKRAGLSVCLVDKETFPRDKICGDALSGKAVTILRELDLFKAVGDLPGAKIHTVTFGSPDNTLVDIDLTRSNRQDFLTGFVIRRKILDNFLFSKSREVADTTMEGFTVREVLKEGETVCGVSGKSESGESIELKAKVVFGADGFNSVIARKLDLYSHDPKHWVVALRCYYKGVKDLTDQIELHYVDEVIPGYFWIFPLEDGYANIGIGMLHEYIKSGNIDLKVALNNAMTSEAFKARFADAEPMEEPIGWNLPVGSKHRKNHGNGFMLLGDAAGLIDPFTGEGIGNAFFSAKFAVATAERAIESGDVSASSLAEYDQTLWDEIGDELKVSHRLQEIGRSRTLLNFVIHKAERSQQVRDTIMGMMANEVPKKQLTNPLFYLKLLFS
ncbi:MAG: NAD(P)/FAD-dependent oxidoreductase [Candidatus Latescibacterota bacterium]|nr:NAD(P)/FAD-dependent oxidoreductase [Candidatus Latescibacterota bacterium]